MKALNDRRQRTPRFRPGCISRQWCGAAAAERSPIMAKCDENTYGRNTGSGLFCLGLWLPVGLLLYVLSIGPAIRFGANNSEMAILVYRPVAWVGRESKPFDTLVSRWVKLWDRGPVPAGAALPRAN